MLPLNTKGGGGFSGILPPRSFDQARADTSEKDMEDYKRLADVIIKYHEDKSGGDELKLINSWRFGMNSDKSVDKEDKDYLKRYKY